MRGRILQCPTLYHCYEKSSGSYSTPKKSDLGQPATASYVDSNRIAIGDVFMAGTDYDSSELLDYDFSIYEGGSNSEQAKSTSGMTLIQKWDSSNRVFSKDSSYAGFLNDSWEPETPSTREEIDAYKEAEAAGIEQDDVELYEPKAFSVTGKSNVHHYVLAFKTSAPKYHFPEQDRSSSIISVIKEIVERIISVVTKSHDYGGLEAERCYTIYDFSDDYVDTLKGANKDSNGKYYAYTGDEIKIASHYVATYGSGDNDNVKFSHNSGKAEGSWTVKHSENTTVLSTAEDACDPSHEDNAITVDGGTYDGADVKLTIKHQEFDSRTKQKSLTAYKKLEKTVSVTELHSISIDKNTKDDEGNEIGSLKDCKLVMKYTGTNNNAYKNGDKNPATSWVSSSTASQDAKGTSTYKSNKFVHSAKIASGKITIVTKAYKNEEACVIGVVNDSEVEIGTIEVYTEPFIARHYTRFRDNIGYGELNSSGKSNTLNKLIYVETGQPTDVQDKETGKVYIGDTIFILTNTGDGDVETTAKLKDATKTAGAYNLGNVTLTLNTEREATQISPDCILKPNGTQAEVLKTGNTTYKNCKITVDASVNNDVPYAFWSGVNQLESHNLVVTTKDTGCDDCYKDSGLEKSYTAEIQFIMTPGTGITNNIWSVDKNAASNGHFPGESVGCNVRAFDLGTYRNPTFYNAYSKLYSKVSNISNSINDYVGNDSAGRIAAETGYCFLNVKSNLGAMSVFANESGAGGDEQEMSSLIAMSPLINNSATNYKKYTNLMWRGTYLRSGLTGIDSDPAHLNGTEVAAPNFDLQHYMGVLYAGCYNMGTINRSGTSISINTNFSDHAIARFKTKNDNGGDYLYFTAASSSVMVTYQIKHKGESNPGNLKVIKEKVGITGKQSVDLYKNATTEFKGFSYDDDGDIQGLGEDVDLNSIIFGLKARTNFRKGNQTVGTGWSTGAYSGTNVKNSVLWITTLSEMTGCTVANGNSQNTAGGTMNESYGEDSVYVRLNATKLGWTSDDVEYVDVYLTYFAPADRGCRQTTFPFRLLGKGSMQ